MFEPTFKNIDDILHKDAGCGSELRLCWSGQLSESEFKGLKDEQDLSVSKKSGESSNQQNPDSDSLIHKQDFKKATVWR